MGIAIGKNNSNRVRIELHNWDGSYAGSISYTKPSLKRKKRLPYNFKAISAQIMNTKTSNGASQVAAKARRQVALLQRRVKSGEYDEEDLENAIAHAKSLERVARKRVKHLRQEEALEKNDNAYIDGMEDKAEDFSVAGVDPEELLNMSEEEIKQLMKELQDAMRDLESQMSDYKDMDLLSDIAMKDLEPADLEQLKRKHRSDELREIMEADMKYLRALFNKLSREKQNASASGSSGSQSSSTGSDGYSDLSGVTLELSGADVPVAAVEMPVTVEGGNMDITV